MIGFSIIPIFLGLAIYGGFFFWIYWYLRTRLKSMADAKYHGRPIALFLFGLLGFIVAGFIILAPFFLLGYSMGSAASGLIWIVIIGIIGVGGLGSIGWIILFFKGRSEKVERQRFEAKHPLPKLQLTMLDLFAAAFGFGAYMAFQSKYGKMVSSDTTSVATLSAWIILSMSCGLYFALDVCRRSLRLQRPLPRLFFVLGVMLYTVMTSLIPAWVSWRAWRYALFKAGWVVGKDMQIQAEASAQPEFEG